jgi:hypothetical protein
MLLARPPAFASTPFNSFADGSPARAGNSRNQPGKMARATRVLGARAEHTRNGVRVIIKADGVLAYNPYTLTNPWRIVIDLDGVSSAIGHPVIPVASGGVNRLRVGQPKAGVVRVVLDMNGPTDYRVDLYGDSLLIAVGKLDGAQSVAGPAPAPAAPPMVPANAVAPQPQPKRPANEQAERADNSAEDRATINRMMRRVEELEARVRDLEAVKTTAAARPAPPPATETVATTTAPAVRQESGQTLDIHDNHDAPRTRPTLQLQGFADVDYRATNNGGTNNAFLLGQLDLFITSRLSDKFNVLSELVIQAGQDNSFSFEIHRLLLQYYPNDYFNLNVGRYHTGIGYYNTAFHHGQWFQTAATRPSIFDFEGQGGVLPLHNVGVSLAGRIPSGSLGLRYLAEVGNGRSINSPGDRAVQTANDENSSKSVNFGLLMRPDWARGMQAGFSIYRDRLSPDGRPHVNQTIMAAHAVFRNSDYEWLNEALLMRHAPAGRRRVFNTPAFYTQVARRFGDTWPFFRYEYSNTPDDDPLFPTVGRRNGPTAGLRYDFTEFAAFKVQYDHRQQRRLRSLDKLLLQLAFTF